MTTMLKGAERTVQTFELNEFIEVLKVILS